MMKKSQNKFAFRLFVLLTILFLVRCNKTEDKAESRHKTDLKEYQSLFKNEVLEKYKVWYNQGSNLSHSYSYFVYNGYELIVHKFDLPQDISTTKLFSFKKGNQGLTPWIGYQGSSGGKTQFSYVIQNDSILEHLYIIQTDSNKKVNYYGDSIVSFNMKSEGLSMSYKSPEINDFVIAQSLEYQSFKMPVLNMNMVLYKRKKSVYIIIVYNEKMDLSEDFILALLK